MNTTLQESKQPQNAAVTTRKGGRKVTPPVAPAKTTIGPSAAERLAMARTPQTVGERMRHRREKVGLRQEDVAELIGMSRPAYGQYESGSSKLTINMAKDLAMILGASPQWLAFGEGPEEAIAQIAWVKDKFVKIADWPLEESWVAEAFHGLSTANMMLYKATHASATMKPGAIAILEKTDHLEETKPGEYLCVIKGAAQIAYLSRRSAGGAIRVSAVALHAGSHAPEEVEIVGRVVGTLQPVD